MEPEVITMYSSSPPPLDDGTEIDDEEFGEFGGFSGVGSSTLGYADFDLEDHHGNFLPQNHFVPGHEYSSHTDVFADFHSANASEGKDFISGFSRSAEGMPMPNELSISTDKDLVRSKSSRNDFDYTATEQTMESIKQMEVTARFDSLAEDAHAIDSEPGEHCNGQKNNPENLTNGYPIKDSTHSQGIENMDNTSDQTTANAHVSEHWSESVPRPIEDFAAFSAFSNVKEPPNLTEENTSGSLSTTSKAPLKEYDSGNHSAFGELPNVQVSLNFAADCDQLKVTSSCKSENGNVTSADVDHTQSSSSEHSTSADTNIANNNWNSSESMEHVETRDQSAQHSVHEMLDEVEETTTTEIKGIQLVVDRSESKDQDIPELETCIHDQEEYGDFTNNVVCEMSTIEHGHVAVSDEQPEADMTRPEENESDHFGISRGNFSQDGDCSTFSPVLHSDPTDDDFGTVDVHCVNSDSKAASKLTTDELSIFREPGVKDGFGDFGSVSTNSVKTFANMSDSPAEKEVEMEHEGDLEFGEHGTATTVRKTDEEEDFGEFGFIQEDKNGSKFAGFKSDEDFSTGGQDTEWNAFGDSVAESTSWAAFGDEQSLDTFKEEMSQCSRTEPALSSNTQLTGWADPTSVQPIEERTRIKSSSPVEESMSQVSLLNRLERVFQTCFSLEPAIEVTKEEICSLGHLLQSGKGEEMKTNNGELLAIWTELQDVEDAHGLRYQWGGSHSNKKLLISLGIDTRNILFTGQRKQPVIVPAYASGLGMLEPTKEPVKPISAAEKIASIGQISATSVTPSELSTSDQTQDHVPPVQFDWSSSGLTNPLDGVDPELYELTTSKLEDSGTVNRMTDAFARLMSTAEKTSTSTRKPKKEEFLSKEAAKVIASLPDLSFMHAKVLMFPTTLTPFVSCCEKAD
ncbi:aftiphilin-like [Scyliorhinus canicula]|uniref:aftiphilin-like n=1 Tax=Scyliorhinus canicula TaxID=7830 RepID=UPI0018F55315|nr:aftiphilin-like [Scyliorhinus canicula]